MKFFKHSGPLPNPTSTDNHDNSDNVAQRSRPLSVRTHLPTKLTDPQSKAPNGAVRGQKTSAELPRERRWRAQGTVS